MARHQQPGVAKHLASKQRLNRLARKTRSAVNSRRDRCGAAKAATAKQWQRNIKACSEKKYGRRQRHHQHQWHGISVACCHGVAA